MRKTFVPSLFGHFMAVSDHLGDGRPGKRDELNGFLYLDDQLDLEVCIFTCIIGVAPSQDSSDHQDDITCSGLGIRRNLIAS